MLGSMVVLAGVIAASAFTRSNADTIFDAYNAAFYTNNGGFYYKTDSGTGTGPGWWTFAEEIEMAEDAYDSAPSAARLTIVSNLCNGFKSKLGSSWSGNNYNDDITWAVIAFSRAYLMTGNSNFRDIAKSNFDFMFARAWETNFAGGGLWWSTDKGGKNACINGPAAIAACYLYTIYGDSSYLSKAQACYAWERQVLFHTDTGAIDDSIGTNYVHNTWASSYNQGTFIGAANFLYRITGLPFYYQDAILAEKFAQNSICSSDGIYPEYGSGDFGGFNGILARWAARFAKDQNLWACFGPWLISNGNAAWNVRNTNNLSWEKWKTPTPAGTNVLASWDCSDTVIIMQVAVTNADALVIGPGAGFTAASQQGIAPNPKSIQLFLTNTSASAFNWSLVNTSAWLNVSANSGTLIPGSPTNVIVSLNPSATTNLAAGSYYANVCLTNLNSGLGQSRSFRLVISGGSAPIAMTGYNVGVLAPNTATAALPNAVALDILHSYCLYQAGLNGSTRGLPPDGVFTSQLDTSTVFQFNPYGTGTNALMIGYGYSNSGTLTLATPQAYNSLSILACSVNPSANGGTGTFVLNFTDGTQSQVFNFNAADWMGTDTNFAIQGIGRLKRNTGADDISNNALNPRIFQTTIDLAALNLNQSIASITFTKPANSGSQQSTAVFAVSGILAYREPVIIQQPAPTNLFRFVGATNAWTVKANAGLPAYYNWCQNGTALPTATNSTLLFTNLQTTNSGDYTVVISNAFGVVTSSVASLTVVPVPTYPMGQAVVADGALGYWRLDESSGTVAHDLLAGNNGTYTPTVLLGQTGYKLVDTHKAARFGSLATTNSCVTNINLDFATSGNGAFSVEAWINGGAQTTDAGIITKGYGGGGEQFNLDTGGSNHGFRFFVRDGGGNARLASSGVATGSQWHHVVGVCDQANGFVYLYVDGTNAATGTITANSGILSSMTPVSIGSRQSGAGTSYNNQFVGYMEEVAIYGVALSPSQIMTHYRSATNRAPVFAGNPFTVASANAGQYYAASLIANASEPNGDTMTFSKISGPAWLSVLSNGFMSGTPASGDVGVNSFVVRVSDPSGLYTAATMNLAVIAAPPIVASAAVQDDGLFLSWTGGIAPYQVQQATNLDSPDWQNCGAPVNVNSLLVTPTNDATFYRIYGQ